MVLKKLNCVFVHIPKCGGSSITKILNPDTPFVSKVSDKNLFVGWCPENLMWMQHATMLELTRIHEENLTNYFKFSFVRNPWERAVSDYLWLLRDSPQVFKTNSSTFVDYLTESGGFEYIFKNKRSMSYRGDHVRTQTSYLYDANKNKLVDYIGRTENFDTDFKYVLHKLGIKCDSIPREKKSKRKHYTEYYDNKTKKIIEDKYSVDIENFNYKYGE